MGSEDSEENREKGILGPDELDISDHPKVESLAEGRYVVSADGPPANPDTDQLEPGFADEALPEAELPAEDAGAAATTTPDAPESTDQKASAETEEEPEEPAAEKSEEESPERRSPPASGGDDEDDTSEGDVPATDESAEPPAVELTQQTVSQFLAESLAETESAYGFDATVNIEGNIKRGRMSSDDIAETLEGLLRWYAKQTTDEVDPEAALGIILAGSNLAVEYPVQSVYAMLKQYELEPDDSISELLTAVREEGAFTVPPSKNG